MRPLELRPTNLPARRTGFVGREKEVAAAKELLSHPDVRLSDGHGPGWDWQNALCGASGQLASSNAFQEAFILFRSPRSTIRA